jgi:hypothetical protein
VVEWQKKIGGVDAGCAMEEGKSVRGQRKRGREENVSMKVGSV